MKQRVRLTQKTGIKILTGLSPTMQGYFNRLFSLMSDAGFPFNPDRGFGELFKQLIAMTNHFLINTKHYKQTIKDLQKPAKAPKRVLTDFEKLCEDFAAEVAEPRQKAIRIQMRGLLADTREIKALKKKKSEAETEPEEPEAKSADEIIDEMKKVVHDKYNAPDLKVVGATAR